MAMIRRRLVDPIEKRWSGVYPPKGWPLYRCSKDKKPGDTNGDGEKGIWFILDPIKFPPAYGGSDGSNTWLFHIRSFLNKFD